MLKKMLNLESCSQLESALLKLKEISKLEVSKFGAGNEKRPNVKYTKLTSEGETYIKFGGGKARVGGQYQLDSISCFSFARPLKVFESFSIPLKVCSSNIPLKVFQISQTLSLSSELSTKGVKVDCLNSQPELNK